MADRNRNPAYAIVFAYALPTLQRIAREHGYALAVHGSMATDFDLIACPWIDEASDPAVLAEAIRYAVHGHENPQFPNPEKKPHGRVAWTFYVNQHEGLSYGPYIDLSIMPRKPVRKKKV